MSDLKVSFTFRLTYQDKTALAVLAERWGCDRGAILRRMIRQSQLNLAHNPHGQFETNGYTFPVKLAPVEGME